MGKEERDEVIEDEEKESRRLLRMQIDDFISENELSMEVKAETERLAKRVMTLVREGKEAKRTREMADTSWLDAERICFPMPLPNGIKLSNLTSSCGFKWVPPDEVEVIGGWSVGFATRSDPALHLNVVIPQKVFGSRDFLNFTYHAKRALYMCWIAKILKRAGLYVQFRNEEKDPLRPNIAVYSNNSTDSLSFVVIHFSPPSEFAKPIRFRPENNNLRPSFCGFQQIPESSPTPMYNSKLLSEVVRVQNEAVFQKFFECKANCVKAVLMIRSWLQKRGFSTRPDGFSDGLLSAWFVHLYKTGVIGDQTPVIDVLYSFFNSLATTDWKKSRFSLSSDVDEARFEQFFNFFDFVFLDYSGYLNLAFSLSTTAFDVIRASASDLLKKIECFSDFGTLFTVDHLFSNSFDVFIRITLSEKYMLDSFAPLFLVEYNDNCGDRGRVFTRHATPLLKEACASRVSFFDFLVLHKQPSKWDLSDNPMDVGAGDLHLLLGLRTLPGWDTALTRGPQAKTSEAANFRKFWGGICELRKFSDNTICEAIMWGSEVVSKYALFHMVRHILSNHLKLSASCCECRVPSEMGVIGTQQKRYDTISRAFDKLSQTLRLLSDLPLLITNVHPVSSFLRRTSPQPPSSSEAVTHKSACKLENSVALPVTHTSPPFISTVEVHLSMEESGKWGEDLEAIARLKTAFYIALANALNEKYKFSATPFADFLLVNLDTVLFRLIISYPKEVHIMRKINGGVSGTLKDSPESRLREREVILRPQLAAHLQSVSQSFGAFAETCQLALYWLSSQLLSDYIDDIIVETIVASVFIKPLCIAAPRTPYVGFLHFLTLLSSHNWLLKPLMVDFNNEWNETDIAEIEKDFVKMRPVLPAMVICTPDDRSGSRWTREEPQPVILKRIISLASSTAELLRRHINEVAPLQLANLFLPSSMPFDVLIHLRARHISRKRTIEGVAVKGCLPVCDYDPIEKYLKCLRENFGLIALFFYNRYGGDRIGVIWKRTAMEPRDAKISSCLHRIKQNGENLLSLNVPAIKEDFRILGRTIVRKVVDCAESC